MEDAGRKPLVALVVLLVIAVPLVLVVVLGGGDAASDSSDAEPAGLRVERTPGLPELTVYVEDADVNQPGTAGNAERVTLRCVDRAGAVVLSERQIWPFSDTDEGTVAPHVHVFIEPERLDRVASCLLLETDPPLGGRLR